MALECATCGPESPETDLVWFQTEPVKEILEKSLLSKSWLQWKTLFFGFKVTLFCKSLASKHNCMSNWTKQANRFESIQE